MTTPAITSFKGVHSFLSNFYFAQLKIDGESYPTVEHAYQAAKTTDPIEKKKIRRADTPKWAKHFGRRVKLPADWEDRKLQVMEALVRQKFQSPRLAANLIATGDAELVEGNDWGDTFWGVCNGVGRNELGKILMRVRADLAKGL